MSSVLDIAGWREFQLSEIFEISGSKTTPKSQLEIIGKGIFPYVTTQATTNGIAGYYDFWTEKGHCLTIDSAVLGVCFYQKQNFSASDHVEILRPKFQINENVAIFLAVLLNKTGKILGYAFNKKRSQVALKKETIKLPIDINGQIDFALMENVIKQTQDNMRNLIKAYNKLKDSAIHRADLLSLSLVVALILPCRAMSYYLLRRGLCK